MIHDPAAGRDMLYNLEDDAAERFDRSAEEPEQVQELRQVIRPFLQAEQAVGEPESIDPDLLRRLKALGYVQ